VATLVKEDAMTEHKPNNLKDALAEIEQLRGVYAVVAAQPHGIMWVVYDLEFARSRAQEVGGVVVAVPILEDYRPPEGEQP
jgi:hypothetical protein